MLYVYSEDILDILLDHGEITEEEAASHPKRHYITRALGIKVLWGTGGEDSSQAIVDLQRDIALKNIISINYGKYA